MTAPTLSCIRCDDDSGYASEQHLVIGFSNIRFHQCIFKKGDNPKNVALMLNALADEILITNALALAIHNDQLT